MAEISFDKVTIEYPVYSMNARFLKYTLASIGTGGVFAKRENSVTIKALNNVSFHLKDGDSVGLVGHNGAGKTTLLRAMAGIYYPSAGNITRKGNISTIIELGAGLDYELSGYENITRLGMLLGLSYAEVSERIPEIEEFTELGDFLSAPVRTYSSGMLMRLMFAVATSNKPEILLVDEMFGTGDNSFREKAKRRMEDVISSAKIFVFASHSEELIDKFCNRKFMITHGNLEEI